MHRDQETLSVLRPEFERLREIGRPGALNVLLLQHRGITPKQALELVPEHLQRPLGQHGPWGGIYDKSAAATSSPEELGHNCVYRTYYWLNTNKRDDFLALAERAGDRITEWSQDYEIDKRTIATSSPLARWIYVLFELAWTRARLYTTPAKRCPLYTVAAVHKMTLAYEQDEAEQLKAKRELAKLEGEVNIYSVLRDPLSASIEAITSLTSTGAVNDAHPRQSKKKRRGRRKATPEDIQADAYLAEKWARAKSSGTRKSTFIEDEEITEKHLNRALDRVRKR